MIPTVKSHDWGTHKVMFWHDFSHGGSQCDFVVNGPHATAKESAGAPTNSLVKLTKRSLIAHAELLQLRQIRSSLRLTRPAESFFEYCDFKISPDPLSKEGARRLLTIFFRARSLT